MKLFLLPQEYKGEDTFTLEDKDHHYLSRVRRLKKGDTFPGKDIYGKSYTIKIVEITQKKTNIELHPLASACLSSAMKKTKTIPKIHLYQAVCKRKKMDMIVRQAAETGVCSFTPIISQHSLTTKEKKEQTNRWIRIGKEAIQQSGSFNLLEINNACSLLEAIKKTSQHKIQKTLFFHQEPIENNSLHRYLCNYFDTISIFIGPEGGFSSDEIESFVDLGIFPYYLGPNVLQVETAALYAIAIVQTIIMEQKYWKPIQ